MAQDTHFQLHDGRTLDLSGPVVMGILNVTPDSFFDGGKYERPEDALAQAEKMLQQGAVIIDIGAVSTRPGAVAPLEEEEWARLEPVLNLLREKLPQAILSVDTWRAVIAEKSVNAGAHIINDISGGTMDAAMFATVGKLGVPYILMHIQGTPETMQEDPQYDDVVKEVQQFFEERLAQLHHAGAMQVILDPGFGFGKTVEHNYQLLSALGVFVQMGHPVLAGLSRKSMTTKLLGIGKTEALNATTALNTIALQKGAKILRVHDVREAVECVRIFDYLQSIC